MTGILREKSSETLRRWLAYMEGPVRSSGPRQDPSEDCETCDQTTSYDPCHSLDPPDDPCYPPDPRDPCEPFCQTCECGEEDEFGFEAGKLEKQTFSGGKEVTVFYRALPCLPDRLQAFTKTVDSGGRIAGVGLWRWGAVQGAKWTRLEGGGWVVAQHEGGQEVFLYPDLSMALVGPFATNLDLMDQLDLLDSNEDGGTVSELSVCPVVGVRCESGVLLPVLGHSIARLPHSTTLTSTVLLSPSVPDPYETGTVKVAPSMIPLAGEGLFTTRPLAKGDLVSYFAGVLVGRAGNRDYQSDYCINWLAGDLMDIPDELVSTERYCATLGHKACHSFQPNCEYTWARHPRFGLIRSISTLRPLVEGEEVLTHYKYNMTKAPDWYRAYLRTYLATVLGWEGPKVEEHVKMMEELDSVDINDNLTNVFESNILNIVSSRKLTNYK